MEAGGGGGGHLTGTAGQAPVHLLNNYIIIGRGKRAALIKILHLQIQLLNDHNGRRLGPNTMDLRGAQKSLQKFTIVLTFYIALSMEYE
jgi:hypothetical protein